jgi:hypothetical protein
METISASEYLRRERIFGEYEHERMVYNEWGQSVPITRLLEDYHDKKMQELAQQSQKKVCLAPGRRQWIQLAPLVSA